MQVVRKDSKEPLENLLRRFNKKVQQSGTLSILRRLQYFEKPISRRERRAKAIVRKARKIEKLHKIRLGIKWSIASTKT